MKTILDQITRTEITNRINTIYESNEAQWGKMNSYQMLKHCVLCEEMYLGIKKYKRTFLGRLIGKWALKNILKDEKELGKNAPTSDYFKVQETFGDIEPLKQQWITLINSYANYPNVDLDHWFFGKMTREEVGFFVFKHADHHLRQFNA